MAVMLAAASSCFSLMSKALAVGEMYESVLGVREYEKANMGGQVELSRTQLELEAVLDLEFQV